MNSPDRLDMEISSPSRTKRTQAMSRTRTDPGRGPAPGPHCAGAPPSRDGPRPRCRSAGRSRAELLQDVADVGARSRCSSPFERQHDAVLVVAVLGRTEPQRAVLLVDVAGALQPIDGAWSTQPSLWSELSLVHTSKCTPRCSRTGFDAGPDALRRPPADRPIVSRRPGRVGCASTAAGSSFASRRRSRRGSRPPEPRGPRGGPRPTGAEVLDLGSEVVEVVLARRPCGRRPRGRGRAGRRRTRPRALPMWSGPVGLADTNSTLTCRGLVCLSRPKPAPAASAPSTAASSQAGERRTLTKPGATASTSASRGGPPPGAAADVGAQRFRQAPRRWRAASGASDAPA